MSFFDFFKRTPEPAPVRIAAKPDPKGKPGTRVYHELFIGDEVNGRCEWSARVYGPDGLVDVAQGSAGSRAAARNAAIVWAEQAKATIRGAA